MFEIFEFTDEIYEEVVLIKNTEDVHYLREQIFESLVSKKGYNFSVLVDLFLRNGYSFNRFALLKFVDGKYLKSYIISTNDVSDNIKSTVKKYLKTNIDVLKQSSLPKKTIEYANV